MRQLTFAGFLKQYLAGLSQFGGGFYKMADEAATSNARLREPLLLYAVYTDQVECLMKATKAESLKSEYQEVLSIVNFKTAIESSSAAIPESYHKVWRSYVSVRDATKRDERTKSLMRDRVLRLQEVAHISTYRIYNDLKLNGGNINAWLKHNDGGKISLDTARRIVSYVEQHSIAY